MPRIDQIVEAMLEGDFTESVLLSDSPARLKDDKGREELSLNLAHHQITSLVEEILPAEMFADLVMMEPVEFDHDHPAGKLKLRVVPGPSIWRVVIRAAEGLTFFEPEGEPYDAAEPAPEDPEDKEKKEKGFEVGGAAESKGAGEDEAAARARMDSKLRGVPVHRRTDSGTFLGVSVKEIFEKGGTVERSRSGTLMGVGDVTDGEKEAERPSEASKGAEKAAADPKKPAAKPKGPPPIPKKPPPIPEPGARDTRELDTVAEPAADETQEVESADEEQASRDDEGAEAEVDLTGLNEMAEAQPKPQPAGKTGRRESPTMNLKIPSFAKEDREPVEVAEAGLEAVDRIIKHASDSGFPDVCLAVGQPPWARTERGFVPMPGWPDVVSERALRSLVGGLLEPAEKRRLKTQGNVSFAYGQLGQHAQVRCSVFRQGNGVTAVMRIPLLDAVDPDALGVPEGTVEMVGRSGLAVVASLPGCGRTTTAFALGSVLAESSSGLAMAVGRPLERQLTHARPVLNIEVGRHAPSAAAALRGALSCGVSVAVVEDPDARGVQKAVELARSGLTVIVTLRAASAIDGVGRLISLATTESSESSAGIDRVTISQVLKCVLYQELLPRSGEGAVAVFERLRPTSTTIAAVQDGRWELVGGRYGRTVTSPGLEASLKELVGRGVIGLKVADAVIQRRKADSSGTGPDS